MFNVMEKLIRVGKKLGENVRAYRAFTSCIAGEMIILLLTEINRSSILCAEL